MQLLNKYVLLQGKPKTEDDECRAYRCSVRRSRKSGNVRWIACTSCDDWYHMKCTEISDDISDSELESMEWNCINCKSKCDSSLDNRLWIVLSKCSPSQDMVWVCTSN